MKFKLNLDKRGYVQIDFSFAAFIFFTLFLVVFSFYDSQKNSIEDVITSTNLQADSRDICYLLISSPGIPNNWNDDLSSMSLPGMKSSTNNSLDPLKVSEFSLNNYFTIIDNFNTGDFMYLNIEGLRTNSTYLSFGVSGEGSALSSSYTCYGNYNSEIVRLLVEIWE